MIELMIPVTDLWLTIQNRKGKDVVICDIGALDSTIAQLERTLAALRKLQEVKWL